MRVLEYLLNVLNFVFGSIKEIDQEMVSSLVKLGGEIVKDKIVKGTFNNHNIIIVPVVNLFDTTNLIAFAHFDSKHEVYVDAKLLEKEVQDGIIELLSHEVEHLKRGPVNVPTNKIKSLNDLGRIYVEEEQIINKKVAPLLYNAIEEAVNSIEEEEWVNSDIGVQFIKGGINLFYSKNEEYKRIIDDLVKGTTLEQYVTHTNS